MQTALDKCLNDLQTHHVMGPEPGMVAMATEILTRFEEAVREEYVPVDAAAPEPDADWIEGSPRAVVEFAAEERARVSAAKDRRIALLEGANAELGGEVERLEKALTAKIVQFRAAREINKVPSLLRGFTELGIGTGTGSGEDIRAGDCSGIDKIMQGSEAPEGDDLGTGVGAVAGTEGSGVTEAGPEAANAPAEPEDTTK